MPEHLGNRLTIIVAGLMLAVASPWSTSPEAQSRIDGGAALTAMVAWVLPAVVSITTRQIERDQFNQPVPPKVVIKATGVEPHRMCSTP